MLGHGLLLEWVCERNERITTFTFTFNLNFKTPEQQMTTTDARSPIDLEVYVTGRWTGSESMAEVFKELRAQHIHPYDWTTVEHMEQSFVHQHYAIQKHIQSSAQAYVFILGDPSYHHSASVLQLGYVLFSSMPVIFVDPDHGSHVPGENGGAEGFHKIISNVHALSALAEFRLQVVPTFADAVALLKRMQWPSTLVRAKRD